MAETVQFELMRPPQIVEARERCPVAYLPLGPLEWHGPHMPMGTDGIHAHRVAVGAARRVGGIVYPPYFLGSDTVRPVEGPQSLRTLGFEGHERIIGMDFPANPVHSLYIEEGALSVIVRELIRLIKQDPYRLVMLVNGHGAPNHKRALQRLAAEESDARARVVFESASGGIVPPDVDPGHAERGETAFVMAALPGIVDLGALPPIGAPLRYRDFGIVNGSAFDGRPTPDFTVPRGSDPRYATAEEGADALARGIDRLARRVTEYLADLPA